MIKIIVKYLLGAIIVMCSYEHAQLLGAIIVICVVSMPSC